MCSLEILKKLFVIVLLTVSVLLVPSFAIGKEASFVKFDLSNPVEQHQVITTPNGDIINIRITPETNEIVPYYSEKHDLGNGYGTWNVEWNNVTINSSFKIDIENYRIVDAYANAYTSVAVDIKDCTLTFSSKRAEQTIHYSDLAGWTTDTRILWASISGTTLTTGIN